MTHSNPHAPGSTAVIPAGGDTHLFALLSEWQSLSPHLRQAGAELEQARRSIQHLSPTPAEREVAERARIEDRFEALLERRLAVEIGEGLAPAREAKPDTIAKSGAFAAKDAAYQRAAAEVGLEAKRSNVVGLAVRMAAIFDAVRECEPATVAGERAQGRFFRELYASSSPKEG